MKRRVLKTKHFARWMKKTELTDESLCSAVDEMQQGLIDADLGGNLYKKRVGLANRGKRGGARTLLATNLDNRWFFVHGFEKNDKSNITNSERDALHQMASHLLTLTEELLAVQLTISELMEICNEHSV
ncbi:MAG: type II toxin-antitoxin system RelE/ParE family toxin [Gammaproteobacteria bacterium]|nr:type II toxin-antitoxin system RelE/ParE family toxin [Gammaproteobacteria bacterium]